MCKQRTKDTGWHMWWMPGGLGAACITIAAINKWSGNLISQKKGKKSVGIVALPFLSLPSLSLSLALCDVRTLSSNLPPLFRRRCPSLVRGCAAYVATLVVSGSPGGWACHTHAHTQTDIHMCVCAKWFRWGKRSGNCKFFTRMRKNKSYAWNVWIGPAHHWESCKQDNNIRCTVEQMQKAQR